MGAKNKLILRLVWLVDTIYLAGEITREEIDRRWVGSPYDDEHDRLQSARVVRWDYNFEIEKFEFWWAN